MNGNNVSNGDRCSCDKSELVESDSSKSKSPMSSKDKKNKISLFNLRRARSLHFTSKRNKKTPQSSTSPSTSTNSIEKTPKWSIKFNCTKKEPKVAFNQENQNCCRCTCYRRTNDHFSGTNTVVTSEVSEKTSTGASVSSSSSNVAVRGYNESRAGQEEALDPISNIDIEQADGIRGIYSTAPATSSIPNIIISAPFLDMQW